MNEKRRSSSNNAKQQNDLVKPLCQQHPQKQQQQFDIEYQLQRTSSKRQKVPSVLKTVMTRSASKKQDPFQTLSNMVVKQIMMNQKCKLCESFAQKQISMSNCKHTFCQKCLNLYVSYRLEINQQLICPEETCHQPINQSCSFFNNLPENHKKKFKIQKLWRQNIDNPNTRLCPNQNCVEGVIDILAQPPICNKCQRTYCKECQLEAHEGPCQNQFEKKFQEWKRCPKCKMFIEKIEGCNHMTCNCSHQFCYVCLGDWQQRHYQCGGNGIAYQVTIWHKICWLISLMIWIFMFPFVMQLGAILGMIICPLKFIREHWAYIIAIVPLAALGFIFGFVLGIIFWASITWHFTLISIAIILGNAGQHRLQQMRQIQQPANVLIQN